MGVTLLSLSTTANASVENMVSFLESSSLILLGIGFAAIGFVRQRKI